MLINESRFREFVLEYCKFNRPKFKRISRSFTLRIERILVEAIAVEIHRHPSIGVTLK